MPPARVPPRPTAIPERADTGRSRRCALPASWTARVVLGDDLDVALLDASRRPSRTRGGGPGARDGRRRSAAPGVGKRLAIGLDGRVLRPVPTVEKRLVVALELVVEHDARDAAAVGFDARGFGLIGAIELDVVGEFTGLHEAGVILLVRRPALDSRGAVPGAPSLPREDDERVGV